MPTHAESTLTSKGQVTIPLPIRRALHLHAGDRLVWRQLEGGQVVVQRIEALSASDLAQLLPPPARSLTLDEIDDASARAWAEDLDALDR